MYHSHHDNFPFPPRRCDSTTSIKRSTPWKESAQKSIIHLPGSFASTYMFQEHNFIKSDHPKLVRRVAGGTEKWAKSRVHIVCVCLLSIFFPLRQHGILLCYFASSPTYPDTSGDTYVFVSDYFSSRRRYPQNFFPWQQTSDFPVFEWNLFFSSRRCAQWNGGLGKPLCLPCSQTPSPGRKQHRKQSFLPRRMTGSEWKSESSPGSFSTRPNVYERLQHHGRRRIFFRFCQHCRQNSFLISFQRKSWGNDGLCRCWPSDVDT